jgi:hypothetical protein
MYWSSEADENDKFKRKVLTYMPNMDEPFEIIKGSGVFCERITKEEV